MNFCSPQCFGECSFVDYALECFAMPLVVIVLGLILLGFIISLVIMIFDIFKKKEN